jgi:hypothetical protein
VEFESVLLSGYILVIFEVLIAVIMYNTIFWCVRPYSLVVVQ